jgi:hypothetical protein
MRTLRSHVAPHFSGALTRSVYRDLLYKLRFALFCLFRHGYVAARVGSRQRRACPPFFQASTRATHRREVHNLKISQKTSLTNGSHKPPEACPDRHCDPALQLQGLKSGEHCRRGVAIPTSFDRHLRFLPFTRPTCIRRLKRLRRLRRLRA